MHPRTIFLGLPSLLAALIALGHSASPASAEVATAVAAGEFHTCALTTAGGLKCWGLNEDGQLGDGATTNRTTPVVVTGLTSGVAAVAAGLHHTCALTAAGAVKCWGANPAGGLGDGTTTTRKTPVDVLGLANAVAAVAAGRQFSCALTASGGVKCWGSNTQGQLGDGTITDRTTPVDVSGLTTGVAAVAAGEDHTCAVTTAGAVKCWGDADGEQGTVPVDVLGLASGVAAVAAGEDHTCALTTAGGVKCWGENFNGQLGDGTTTGRTTPVDVSGLTTGVAAISVGVGHSCAVTTAGGLKCWGLNEDGQLGDGTTTNRTAPADVLGLANGVAAVAAGREHTCALTTAGGLKCWGSNRLGQLGDGMGLGRTSPVDVLGFGAEPAPTPTLGSQLPAGGGVPPASDAGTNGWKAPLLAGGIVSSLLALAAGAWYARRRLGHPKGRRPAEPA